MRLASGRRDLVVVGGGPAGLTAALRARAAGHEVTVVEARPHLGGALHSFETPWGPCDAGPHLLTGLGPGQDLSDLWHGLGVEVPTMTAIRPPARLLGPRGEAMAPRDPEGMAASLTSDWGRHALAVLLQAAHEMIGLPWDIGVGRFFTVPARAPTFLHLLPMTLDEAFDDLEVPWEDRWRLAGYWGFVGAPPEEISAVFYAYLLRIYLEEGGWRPEAGLGALRAALVAAAERAGIELRTGAAVTAVRYRGARVRALTLAETAPGWDLARGWDGTPGEESTLLPEAVIWTGDPRPLADGLPGIAHRLAARLERVRPSAAGIRLSWPVPEARAPTEILVHGPTFVGEIRGGGWVHRYGYLDGRTDRRSLEAHLEGDPPAGAVAGPLRTTPEIHAGQLLVRGGPLYGAAFGPDQVGFGRLQPRTPVRNLLLAGHWTSPGSGVAGAAISGDRSARLLDRRRPLLWRRTA